MAGSGSAGQKPQGLTSPDVAERRRQYGENRLPQKRGPTAWSILLDQFKSPLVYIILVAAAISLIAGQRTDFIIIMAVVALDVGVGFVEEYQAHRTYTALRSLLRPTSTVIRDGQRQEVEAGELVPGDVVALSAGERIPADGDVIESARLAVDEAILTGESESIDKSQAAESRRLFMGTTVVAGRGLMVVQTTGSRTELGRIAGTLGEGEQEQETPLRRRLRGFSRVLTVLVIAVTAAVLLTGLLMGRDFMETLRVSIVLAIAAVPEALLIAVTLSLILGMRTILRRNGLVRKLVAVETLGSVTVICTDKTGTLTEGLLRVTRSDLADRERALLVAVLCNNREGPVETALWEYARQELGEDPQKVVDRSQRLAEEPFSSEHKYMIVAVRLDGQAMDYLKGAPEAVIEMCDLAPAEREALAARVEQWAAEGLKPLGLAYRPSGPLEQRSGYRWAGLLAMADPIRPGVAEAIAVAGRAGIQVKMITGDFTVTAQQVARSIGLAAGPGQVMEGAELESLDDAALEARVMETAIFSRIKPHDKLRIVRALQARGMVAAMVGDGVNDAPALQRANIGVVVGSAADVAKETADLILLDSNFRTIVLAIEEGRTVFENIRKIVSYTVSNSFAEVLAILTAQLLGFPPLLTVVQILWIHLICDGPPDIVLGFEPHEPGIMEEKPKPLSEPILTPLGIWLAVTISLSSALFALGLFANQFLRFDNVVLGQSLVFAVFAVDAMIYIFGYRTLRCSLLRSGNPIRNKPLVAAVLLGLGLGIAAIVVPPLQRVLGLTYLSPAQWFVILGLSFGLLLIVELAKSIYARVRGARGQPTTCE